MQLYCIASSAVVVALNVAEVVELAVCKSVFDVVVLSCAQQLYPAGAAGNDDRMIVPATQTAAENVPAVAPPAKLDAMQEPVVPTGTEPVEI